MAETRFCLSPESPDPRGAWLGPDVERVHDQEGVVLTADTIGLEGDWHTLLVTPVGLLPGGGEARVTVRYAVDDLRAPDSFFAAFARSDSLGMGADQWTRWGGRPGDEGEAVLRLNLPEADDFQVFLNVFRQGRIRVREFRVEAGVSGWQRLSLTRPLAADARPVPVPESPNPIVIDRPLDPLRSVVHAREFGVEPGSDEERPDAAPGLARALEHCRETGAGQLRLGPGTYWLLSGEGLEVHGLEDFVLDGNGARLVFSQGLRGVGFSVRDCLRCEIRDLVVDWDWEFLPLAVRAEVVAVEDQGERFRLRFAEPLDSLLPRMRWRGMTPIDPATGAPAGGSEVGVFEPLAVRQVSPFEAELEVPWPFPLAQGRSYLIRNTTYERHAFVLHDNAHLTFQALHIRSFPGAGLVVNGDQHHWQLLGCSIDREPGSDRPISTTADGLHVSQSQGYLRIQDCRFGWMGDDCINVHDTISQGLEPVDSRTVTAKQVYAWRNPFQVGDPVEFLNGDLSPTGITRTLAAVAYDHPQAECRLVFTEDLDPGVVQADAVLVNRRYDSGHYEIRNCLFHHNRARGILAQAHHGLIEGNRFLRNQHAAVHSEAGCESRWAEGMGGSHLILRGNRFEACNPAGYHGGATVHIGAYLPRACTPYPAFTDILFEANTFIDPVGEILEASSVANLVLRDNQILVRSAPALRYHHRGSVRLEHARGVQIHGNRWDGGVPGVATVPGTVVDLSVSANRVVGSEPYHPPDRPTP
jgi:hypothetical protein